ncbi:MAG: hypothetical protein MJ048_00455 [Acidaminococcaceae bacterium]|nr:hypothetical protein [Acidaminococcaceae bacterium]
MCDKNALGEPAEENNNKNNNNENNNCPIELAPPSEEAKKAEEKFDKEVLGE